MIVVINARNLAVSEYDVGVLDVVAHNGKLYCVQAASLVALDAEAEADFTTTAETGMLSLGVDDKKYIPWVKATLSGDSVTTVTMTAELDGDSRDLGPYELVGRSGPAFFVRKWKFSGGIKADSVAITINASAGTVWKLQGLVVSAELL